MTSNKDEGFSSITKKELTAIANSRPLKKLVLDLIKSVAEETIPGKIAKAGHTLMGNLKKIEDEEREGRVREFILGILECDKIFMSNDLDEVDFISIIQKLTADNESDKSRFYIRLAVGLAEGSFTRDKKIYLLNVMSSLTVFQINYARNIYIRSSTPLCGYKSCSDAVSELTENEDGMSLQALNALISCGLLLEKAGEKGDQEPRFSLNESMRTLIKLLYHHTDLLPEAIEKKSKNIYDIIIIKNITSFGNVYEEYFTSLLEGHGYSVGLVPRVGKIKGIDKVGAHVLDNFSPYYIQSISSESDSKKSIKLYLTSSDTPVVSSSTNLLAEKIIEKDLFFGGKKKSKEDLINLKKEIESFVNYIVLVIRQQK